MVDSVQEDLNGISTEIQSAATRKTREVDLRLLRMKLFSEKQLLERYIEKFKHDLKVVTLGIQKVDSELAGQTQFEGV